MRNKIVALVLVLILSSFVLFLRVRAISLPSIDKLSRSEALSQRLDKIQERINEKYKEFSKEKKDELISRAYNDYLKQNKYAVEEKVREKIDEKKAFYRNDNNHTYMFGIDSYYWLRLIDNLIKKGRIGDRIVDGKNYDDLVDMPIEDSLSRSIHLIMGKFIYKIFNFLKIDVDYEIGLYLIPLLFSILLTILTFFVTKLVSGSNMAAFFAGLAINLSPLLLQRTTGEWLDTDIYSVFFPLLIFGAFLFVFKSIDYFRKIIGVIIFSIACSLYASIWQGWWYIFDLLLLCGLLFIVNDYFSEHQDINLFKNNILWLSLLFVSGILLVWILNGKESCLSFVLDPGRYLFALKSVPKDNWPNVFLTVAELKRVSPYKIAFELGGISIFFITILGSIYLILFRKILRDRELGIGFFCLFIWLGILYYTSLTAIRFALLLIVPLGVMFGIVFDRAIRKAFIFSHKLSRKMHFLVLGILVTLIYILVSTYVTRSIVITTYKLPMMNDAWYKSLTFIKQNSSDDAIINSWWDYGHWFKAIANRQVLFDGKTQNSPIAFWMAKVLISDDEEEAIGILRMLDLSKNKAFDLLKSYGLSHVRAIDILKALVQLSENDARDYLNNVLDKEKIDKLMPLLFSSDMPRAYFIVSYDMMGKMTAISFIGNWDFKKGDIWLNFSDNKPNEFLKYLREEYGYDKQKSSDLLKDLRLLKAKDAPGWISKVDAIYFDTLSNKFKKDGDLLLFDNGMVFDLSNLKAYIQRGSNNDIGIPYSVVYILNEGDLKENKLEGSNLGHSLLLFKEDKEDSYKSLSLDKDLSKSMFVRMYFLKGQGLKYFKKVLEEKTPEGNLIYIYQIEWPK